MPGLPRNVSSILERQCSIHMRLLQLGMSFAQLSQAADEAIVNLAISG